MAATLGDAMDFELFSLKKEYRLSAGPRDGDGPLCPPARLVEADDEQRPVAASSCWPCGPMDSLDSGPSPSAWSLSRAQLRLERAPASTCKGKWGRNGT